MMPTLQEALAEYLGKKTAPPKEEQAAETHQTHQAAETLTTQQRVAQAIVDARHK
jgi:hypothetical protein